jgi:hypothetical protein
VPVPVLACGAFLTAVCCAALTFALLRPVRVLPFLRPAPPVVLRDADGMSIAFPSAATITIFQVSALRCPGPCEDGHPALQAVQRHLEAVPPAVAVRLVTIVLDGEGRPGALRRRAAALGADRRWWRLATSDPAALKDRIGGGLGVYYAADHKHGVLFDPATILVDERGIVRAEYRTARPDAAGMVRDLDLVRREASSRGAARAAYAAAHLFLCYPR